MSIHYLQVTIGAGGNTQVTTTRTPCKEIIVQNNDTSNTARVGDSATSATKGLLLDKRTSGTYTNNTVYFGPFNALDLELSSFFVAGTQNSLIDIIYEK